MIRYNANDPEIHGKKHFDILFNIGLLCLVYAASLLVRYGMHFFAYMLGSSTWSFGNFTEWCVENIFNTIYALFWIIIGTSLLLPNKVSKKALTQVCKYSLYIFAPLSMMWLGMWLYEWSFHVSARGLIYPMIIAADCALTLYLIVLLKRLFSTSTLSNMTEKQITSPPAEGISCEPRHVILFEKWDPLYGYGKLLMLFGLFCILPAVWNFVAWLNETTNAPLEITNNLLYRTADWCISFVVFFVCGYGLMRHKEWGRVLGLLAHTIMPTIWLVQQAVAIRSMNRVSVGEILPALAYVGPPIILGYIVVRALCHPVVKYVCLRGGHDID